jgi:hypothetical protein
VSRLQHPLALPRSLLATKETTKLTLNLALPIPTLPTKNSKRKQTKTRWKHRKTLKKRETKGGFCILENPTVLAPTMLRVWTRRWFDHHLFCCKISQYFRFKTTGVFYKETKIFFFVLQICDVSVCSTSCIMCILFPSVLSTSSDRNLKTTGRHYTINLKW